MRSNGPIFPYQNLFITARPGMGATTVALNIMKKYMDLGKKCLVLSDAGRLSEHYIERMKALCEGRKPFFPVLQVEKHGSLAVMDCNHLILDSIVNTVDELDKLEGFRADVVVIDEPVRFALTDKELISLSEHFREEGIIFIFVTHIKRKLSLFLREPKSTPSASLYRRAMRHFDAVAVVFRNGFSYEVDEVTEELRIYEQSRRKYRAVPVEFDFERQTVRIK